jgi:hypothetical protein
MALSNAEKQRRWRSRHFGVGGTKEQLECAITIPAKRNLERLACHYGFSMTKLLEMLINNHTTILLNILNQREQNTFYAQLESCRAVENSAKATWDIASFYSRLMVSCSERAFNELDQQ